MKITFKTKVFEFPERTKKRENYAQLFDHSKFLRASPPKRRPTTSPAES
jgi:hypothetical protein